MVQVVPPPTSLLSLPPVFRKALASPHTFRHLSFTFVTDLWVVPTALTFSVMLFQIGLRLDVCVLDIFQGPSLSVPKSKNVSALI